MPSADPLAVLEVPQRNELEALLMDFDQSWEPESLDLFGRSVASHPSQKYRDLALSELVKVDLQRSWSAGIGRRLEMYLGQFPSLGNTESVSAALIVAEFEARSGVDSELALASYESRFPQQFQQVKQLASQLMDSSPPKRTEQQPVQASIETSRIDELRDTKASKKQKMSVIDFPCEFGRYRILKELGSGAMGKVYLAHDSQLDRQVALKTPSFAGGYDDEFVTRFYREARAAAKLQHRNICPIYDVGEIDGRHFISMAFVKGRSMSEYIRPDKLPPQRTSALLVQRLALALSEAHLHNIIHRDLKPANIMIDLKKEPIVMDFGLARQTDMESRVTRSGMSVGTPAYMSPEQIRGELDEVGPQADIYALGVILYELLTGQLPFRGPIAKVVYSIVHDEPTAPSGIRDAIAPELEAICLKMMAKDCTCRYQSMDEVAFALKSHVTSPFTEKSLTSSQANHSVSVQPAELVLTENGELNAFFATPTQENPLGTMIESTSILHAADRVLATEVSTRSRRRRRNRPIGIAAGFAGGLILLLSIIIYFNGGKVELDEKSNAVVKVDGDGNITIQPGTNETNLEIVTADSKNTDTSSTVDASPRAFEASQAAFDPVPELLNEWTHIGGNLTNAYAAALAPDGSRVAYRIGTGPLRIFDITANTDLELPDEMEDAISSAFSADGRLIVTGHEDKRVRLWDADTFAPVGKPFESPIEPKIGWVFLSGDGTRVIAMASDREVKLKGMAKFFTWEIASGELISRFQAEMDDQNFATSIDAPADGRRLAVVSLHDGITMWDTTTGQRLPVKFNIPEDIASRKRITGMDLSPDGSRLAYGVLNGAPSYAAILDTSTGQEVWNSGKQNGRVHTVQFSGDGKWLASTAAREQATQVSIWEVSTGAERLRWLYQLKTPHENYDRVKFLSFSGDDSRILLAGPFMPVVVWRIKSAN